MINDHEEMLFVIHAVFNKLLPPGGHVEKGDNSLKDASMRETNEETEVHMKDIIYVPADEAFPELPFDVNSYPIPQHPGKKEPPHTHHDLRYVFRYTGCNNDFNAANLFNSNLYQSQQFLNDRRHI